MQTSPRVPITEHAILSAFDTAGFRTTRPRRLIAQRLAARAASGSDFATDELWQELQREDPQLGRATLFRAVDVLVELGVLDRIELADGTRRYRVCDRGHHHHLICTECGRIEEVDLCVPEAEMASAASRAGFEVERHALEIYGRCADCRRDSGHA
jgi:Fe2+ or Zn2+ uptake regulation protein